MFLPMTIPSTDRAIVGVCIAEISMSEWGHIRTLPLLEVSHHWPRPWRTNNSVSPARFGTRIDGWRWA